ncbi:MAG: hypothetical protein JSV99_02750 [Planctomycetota bacterium]|nr:MAG: hypothetical protein JSV99_02750 [Planctomycetota bacterium]
MALVSSGIEKVRAFELPGGIWPDGSYAGCPRIALVKWHSHLSNMFYQVYVNGWYAGSTLDGQQRQMMVQIPTSLETAVRIEVFAVEAEQANTDFSSEIESSMGQCGRAKIDMLRSQKVPIGATVQLYSDGGSGEIDYNSPLNDSPVRVWPAWQDKTGFGMARFGTSDFGFDGSAAVGFGKGVFGRGEFGFDADVLEWTSPLLETGIYKFAVKVTDEGGSESGVSETGQLTVIPAARPAERMSIFSFDKQENQLVLSVL